MFLIPFRGLVSVFFFVGEVVLYTLLYATEVALFDLYDCLIIFLLGHLTQIIHSPPKRGQCKFLWHYYVSQSVSYNFLRWQLNVVNAIEISTYVMIAIYHVQNNAICVFTFPVLELTTIYFEH
jgi:hypothetical protein